MGSFVARLILWLIFGFLIYESINEVNKLFGLSLNPYFSIIPTVLVCVFQEFMIKKWTVNEKAVPSIKSIESKIDKVFYVIVWIIVGSLFLVILIVWAGVIYKEIIKGM